MPKDSQYEPPSEAPHPCPDCGYDLGGHKPAGTDDPITCPECGKVWTRHALTKYRNRLPSLGWFWWTALVALFLGPMTLCIYCSRWGDYYWPQSNPGMVTIFVFNPLLFIPVLSIIFNRRKLRISLVDDCLFFMGLLVVCSFVTFLFLPPLAQ